jgi:VanZ family protein
MLVRSLVKYWIPVVAWMLLIFVASGDLMSAEHTSRFLVPFLRWLKPDISPETIAQIQFLIRKFSHITEYAILSILLLRALRGSLHRSGAALGTMALGAALLFAASDEFHQSFVPSRTASPFDVMIDVCGAGIGLAIYLRATCGRATKK